MIVIDKNHWDKQNWEKKYIRLFGKKLVHFLQNIKDFKLICRGKSLYQFNMNIKKLHNTYMAIFKGIYVSIITYVLHNVDVLYNSFFLICRILEFQHSIMWMSSFVSV